MRVTALQLTPSVEVLYTRSLVEQFARKRQSSQTVQIVPPPSTAAEGKGPLRIPPADAWNWILETVTGALQLAPPSADVNAAITPVSIGTTTFPLGCTSGCPPMPLVKFAVGVGTPQVNPPSLVVLMRIWSLLNGSSHST